MDKLDKLDKLPSSVRVKLLLRRREDVSKQWGELWSQVEDNLVRSLVYIYQKVQSVFILQTLISQ